MGVRTTPAETETHSESSAAARAGNFMLSSSVGSTAFRIMSLLLLKGGGHL
jgi:hypothetical protein